MNRTQLLQLSADLDRVINLGGDNDEDDRKKGHLLRNTAIGVGGLVISDNAATYAIGRGVPGPVQPGLKGIRQTLDKGANRIGSNAERFGQNLAENYAIGKKLNPSAQVGRMARAGDALKRTAKGFKLLSAKTENLLNLSAELDQVVQFDWMGTAAKFGKKLLVPSVAKEALTTGAVGAGIGAIGGGIQGGLSNDPNASVLGGAAKGAALGGIAGAGIGAGMRASKILGRSAVRPLAPAANATAAAAAADQMAAKVATPAVAPKVTGMAPRPVDDLRGAWNGNVPPATSPVSIGQDEASMTAARIKNRWSGNPAQATTSGLPKPPPEFRKRVLGYSSRLQSLVQLSADLEDVVEFKGGYVNTDEGVKKERGAGAHFNRAAGRYIGSAVATPLIGLPVGYMIDRSRAKHNKLVTSQEVEATGSLKRLISK
jgi:hypothetical protein